AGGGGAKKATQAGAVPVRVDTVVKLDPTTMRPVADIRVGETPAPIVFSGGFLWIVNEKDETISQVDPKTGGVETTGGLPSPGGIASDGQGAVWVASCGPPREVTVLSRTMTRLDTTL